MNFKSYLKKQQKLIDQNILKYLPAENEYPQIMAKAMRYSLLIGAKRIRPILVLEAARLTGGQIRAAMPTAVALELIHTYSLIHDDLPAMDNDDLRRGQPTSHKVFGEALAILAGDCLMTRAYEIIARHTDQKLVPAKNILKVIAEIGQATGFYGMVGGQAVDLASEDKKISGQTLKYIHEHKTASLIVCALRAGAILAASSERALKALGSYGQHLGLAFQIVDDILDVEGESQKMGKLPGQDQKKRKATYPAIWGLNEAKKMAAAEAQKAEYVLEIFGARGKVLKQLVNFVVYREK